MHKRTKTRPATITLEARLAAPKVAGLWETAIHGRPHLPAAALLSMAASTFHLVCSEDHAVGLLSGVAMVAPLVLSPAAAVATLTLTPASGAAELTLAEQKLLGARLGFAASAASSSVAVPKGTAARLPGLLGMVAAGGIGAATSFANTAALTKAQVSGYAVHPGLLGAAIAHAAMQGGASTSPRTWVRTVAAMSLGATGAQPATEASLSVAMLHSDDAWLAADIGLSTAGAALAQLMGVVVGEHDLPPTSPGPRAMQAEERSAEPEAESESVVAADNPLLAMPEEERLLHLQAQVGGLPGGMGVQF